MSQIFKIYRKQNCPFGKKAIQILQREGMEFQDHIFASKDEEEAFKKEHQVSTTPQIFMGETRIGGASDLEKKYGELVSDLTAGKKTYTPVFAVFATTALLAWATSKGFTGFMGYSLVALAMLKLMDIPSFVEGFKQYDLITSKIPSYGKIYPFLELLAGLGFLSGASPLLTGILSAFVGIAGGVSVIKAVYIDKKDLNCACVGGNQNVPLGIISFTENAMMALMGIFYIIICMIWIFS